MGARAETPESPESILASWVSIPGDCQWDTNSYTCLWGSLWHEVQLELPAQTSAGVWLGCTVTFNASQPLLWSHKHFGVGSQRLFAQNFRADAFFFIKSCSARACLFLLLIRAVVGYRSCLGSWHFITLFWKLSVYELFHCSGLHPFS